MSKGHDKGGYGITVPKREYTWRQMKVNVLKNCGTIFFLLWGRYGGVASLRGEAEKPEAMKRGERLLPSFPCLAER
jgi:hypothetical protein